MEGSKSLSRRMAGVEGSLKLGARPTGQGAVRSRCRLARDMCSDPRPASAAPGPPRPIDAPPPPFRAADSFIPEHQQFKTAPRRSDSITSVTEMDFDA
ncbi:hypothetical protein EVAR_53107_1 [Eumeta japonica]|uniref:Uncharacterized protein n=1 Tax=Eumeta variegata TaxID=151549 RepID=A0A4C1Y9L1_EUMVA|nr:hypothetical protein EVAR_53107_1 [Eumeta japonica]